ncbi:MAG: hypothetical protein WCJ11_04405 [Methylococcaceae bacterium]
MKQKHVLLTATFLGLVSVASVATAASCEEYPYTDGINVENVQGGVKIISTASTAVSFDDVSAIKSARDEAMMEAKSYISKFLNEGIKSDETISKAINETVTMKGQSKEAERKEVKEILKKMQNSSQALLRGVVPLGDCYTKARELRVSVGVKPDTINQAGNLATGMGNSLSSQPTPNNAQGISNGSTGGASNGATGGNLQGSEGFSNTTRLQNF